MTTVCHGGGIVLCVVGRDAVGTLSVEGEWLGDVWH